MPKIEFTIPGEPTGKGRPKFSSVAGRVNARTPDETVMYENYVKMQYMDAAGQATSRMFGDDEQIAMTVKAYYKIPKSVSKKKRQAMVDNTTRPTKKPDADNILKIIADSLNEITYRDDSQIVDASVSKYYSDVPRVEVTLKSRWMY